MTAALFDVPEISSAVLSDDEKYRYVLTRIWDGALPLLVFAMLNPSKAGAYINDPTVLRCIDFAKRWGYGGIIVVNIFGLRATDPAELSRTADPIGPENDRHLLEQVTGRVVVCAWGASVPKYWRHRPVAVRRLIAEVAEKVCHLGLTKDGHPRHPLYLRSDTQPTEWAA